LLAEFTDHDWCERDPYGPTPSDVMIYGWQNFCDVVKHHRRYTFANAYDPRHSEYDEEHIHPGLMLPSLTGFIQAHTKTLKPGTLFWRAQILDANETPKVPDRFTSPPDEKALQPNRMSPSGISMFYGAADIKTAREEVVGNINLTNKQVWGIQFESVESLNFFNLTDIPDCPDYFSSNGYELQHEFVFFHSFRKDLAKPISQDGHEHIEYVPTQILTEYIRYEVCTRGENPELFHGIIYPSSKTGEPCYVIFANQSQCLDSAPFRKGTQLLRAKEATLQKIS
jgi:hypothetical protein